MEIARRIDVRIHRTIKNILATMFVEGELDRSDVETVHKNIKARFYWRRNTDDSTVREIIEFKKQLQGLRNFRLCHSFLFITSSRVKI